MSENLNLLVCQSSFHTIWVIAQIPLFVSLFMVCDRLSSCGGFNSRGVEVFSPGEVFLMESLEIFLHKVRSGLADGPNEGAFK